MTPASPDEHAFETREWLDSLEDVLAHGGSERVCELLEQIQAHARRLGVGIPFALNTPYVNTIPADRQPPYPGSQDLEQRLRNILRWNVMIMVVRANQQDPTIGGHIATYTSVATLYEVALNHFIRGRTDTFEGDQVFFQPHASPGIYARAFLEGRLSETQLVNFRRELAEHGGLPSYPHPRLMPDFWEFPTASMGLSSVMAIYQARFNRYLQDRGLIPPSAARVWAFIGDGETDEPESLGAISLAAREKLDNLIFVINCNLQRLDGPVRGNGKIIQELETFLRGAGWNVLKVVWGSDWDPLLARDDQGLLAKRMGELVDGQYQKYSVSDGRYQREHFFGVDPRLMEMSKLLTDEHIRTIRRGGHDPNKVYAAYKAATEYRGGPSVILAKTIKGYGMGEVGEGRMTAHQQKKIDVEMLKRIRSRFGIPLSDAEVEGLSFYRPPDDSPELRYLQERRAALGGYVPHRVVPPTSLRTPAAEVFEPFNTGQAGRETSTTMVFVRLLSRLLADPAVGRHIVPIVADEARTFGMESLFRQYGIYSHIGQLYDPIDSESLTYYREAKDGQLLEEGITEAGAMSSFIAAGTSHVTHGLPMLPVFILYSMFGFQRIGDLIYAAGDQRARGFLIGATAGRTTLNGEGLQHQDGHSQLTAYTCPHVVAYDPAFGYEVAAIVRHGIARMHVANEDVIFYLTVYNETYPMLDAPDGAEEGILRGLYRLRRSTMASSSARAHLLASGSILNQALEARALLEERFGVAADVWSITSFQQLHRDGSATDRWNWLHPDQPRRRAWIAQCLDGEDGAFVIASDFIKALPDSIARWCPRAPVSLGTDGFGRSESRPTLRRFFEVDAATMVWAALGDLVRQGRLESAVMEKARTELAFDPDKVNPLDT